jgi:phosphatidylinositol alpha-mannosyltransferase
LKITIVTYYLPPVDRIGSGVQMHMLAQAYTELGHDVTVLSPNDRTESNATYNHVSCRIVGKNRIVKWAMFLRTYQFDADLVHFGGDDHLVRRNREFVHIRTFHGSCFAEALVANRFQDKLRMIYLGCTELISQRRHKVNTVVSPHTNRFFLRPNHVVPNGVDLLKFVPADVKSKNPSILFIGMLDSRKRGRQLVEAFSTTVRDAFPNAELWIVRDDTELQIPGVKVFGGVSEAELIDLYQQAWVFCLPSSYEGFGVPYIEAMACGTPVVATPNPGALQVLDGGRYGLYVRWVLIEHGTTIFIKLLRCMLIWQWILQNSEVVDENLAYPVCILPKSWWCRGGHGQGGDVTSTAGTFG